MSATEANLATTPVDSVSSLASYLTPYSSSCFRTLSRKMTSPSTMPSIASIASSPHTSGTNRMGCPNIFERRSQCLVMSVKSALPGLD